MNFYELAQNCTKFAKIPQKKRVAPHFNELGRDPIKEHPQKS